MDTLFFIIFLFSCAFLPLLTYSGPISVHSISPNFTASNFQFIDHGGTFLVSINGTFKATITDLNSELHYRYYLSIIHVKSSTVIWSANRDTPISQSSELWLTIDGLRITNEPNQVIWSTPVLNSKVAALQLLETGNLVLVDDQNVSLWQSFDYPTDTIVVGQRLRVNKTLVSNRSADELASGGYRLMVTDGDAVLQWKGMTYWKMSNDIQAYKDSNSAVSFMEVNGTGLFLLAGNGSTTVFNVKLGPSEDFRIAKMSVDGRLSISSSVRGKLVEEFSAPSQLCQIPLVCGRLGLCSSAAGSVQGNCACPPGFYSKIHPTGSDCVPTNESLLLPPPCKTNGPTSSELNSSVSYVNLGIGMDYFANGFMDPFKSRVNLSVCQDLCFRNCSCLAIFHQVSSGSCYLIENELGSIMATSSTTQNDRLGYIKAFVVPSARNGQKRDFPIAGLILIPSSGFVFMVAVILFATLWLRLRTKNNSGATKLPKLDRWNSSSSAEIEVISIPGLPVRFDYEVLVAATENFKTRIGSGGFGTVYKGTLPDKTVVAVKKITNLGVSGKKEFFTEVSIIANIHHVNLVRLKGFCVQGNKRFLVFEFMNKGSLDRVLFGNGPVLEWKKRFEIALGTARGLAYLHNGCDHKIIHCDVKPENILLHDNSQVKISDFGLSKLLSPEQSGLFTTMRGTRGYLAPEWLTSSAISDKADVYSYGMVLLEIVRGRKNSSLQALSHNTENDSNSKGSSSTTTCSSSVERQVLLYFPLLALEMHEEKRYLELADPRLEGRVSSEDVEKLIKIGLCCVQEDPSLRPSMANVVGMLEGALPMAEPRVQSLNFLRFYGRRFIETSQVEGCNHQNEFGLWNSNSTNGSYNSVSYISSQQLSGPR